MSHINPNPGRPSEEFQVSSLRFLGEQDGAPERELKNRLSALFMENSDVRRAYLAKVAYGDGTVSVVLCLRAQPGTRRALIEKIGKVFAAMFRQSEHLDTLILTDAHEAELVLVCNHFYSRAEQRG